MNDVHALVADSVDRMLAQHAGSADDPDAPLRLWQAAIDAGLTQVLAADDGVFDTDALRDAVTILRRSARAGAPMPVAEGMLAGWLTARAGWPASDEHSTVALDIEGPGTGTSSTATLAWVPWGRHAKTVMTLASTGDSTRIARYVAPAQAHEPHHNLAGEPRDTLHFAAAAVTSDRSVDATEVLALAALLRAAQMTGAMEGALELALEHAKTRQQFGRPIGNFQAVQQLLARHAGQVAAATAAVDLAVDRWNTPSAVFHAAIAKSRAGEAAGAAAEYAHQVIAAMGFAMEHPLQRVTRRLWAWRDDYGNEAYWNERIGARILAAGADRAWLALIDDPALMELEP